MKKLFVAFLLLIFGLQANSMAQALQDSSLSEAEILAYKDEVRGIVNFYSYMLNILGDRNNPASYKQTIIEQSYLKIFQDAEVQVEDDLVSGRSTMTNKDVQAYLKDVDFFFKHIRFEHDIEDIQVANRGESGLFFLVESTRIMEGRYADGDSVNDQEKRFFEINLNFDKGGIKIASIYTTGEALKPELTSWWNTLNKDWRNLLGDEIFLNDSVSLGSLHQKGLYPQIGDTLVEVDTSYIYIDDSLVLNLMAYKGIEARIGDSVALLDTISTIVNTPRLKADLKHLVGKSKINFSGKGIRDISPLEQFEQLTALNLSQNNISNIFALRQLKGLKKVDLSDNPLKSVSALRYLQELDSLDLSFTKVNSLEDLKRLNNLTYLNLDNTSLKQVKGIENLLELKTLSYNNGNITNLQVIGKLRKLEFLQLNNSKLQELKGVSGLKSLQELEIENTQVQDLEDLKTLHSLVYINAAGTKITSLKAVNNLLSLREMNVNESMVSAEEVKAFQTKNDYVTIFFNTKELSDWWASLPEEVQAKLKSQGKVKEVNARSLHNLIKIRNLDLSKTNSFNSLELLRPFQYLQSLNVSDCPLDSLEGIENYSYLQEIDISSSRVKGLGALDSMANLKLLWANNTPVDSLPQFSSTHPLEKIYLNSTKIKGLKSLLELPKLKLIEANNTELTKDSVWFFLKRRPQSCVIFRKKELELWWYSLSPSWQKALKSLMRDDPEDIYALHNFTARTTLEFNSKWRLNNVQMLAPFFMLEELVLDDMGIRNLRGINKLGHLKSLRLSKNPISDLKPLTSLTQLSYLDISNTAIPSLQPLENITSLKALICSGNQIRSLQGLESLHTLEHLDCSSTRIKSLAPVMGLVHIKTLNCTNTELSKGKVSKFRDKHPLTDITYY
ncbi:MAG: hypothetical protein MRZ79_25675 [Bacteroidia bacterium]|nr:hypothetical protein [Bacteroidia bacterium]